MELLFLLILCSPSVFGQSMNRPIETSINPKENKSADQNTSGPQTMRLHQGHELLGCKRISDIVNSGGYNWKANPNIIVAMPTPGKLPNSEVDSYNKLGNYNQQEENYRRVARRQAEEQLPLQYDARKQHYYCKTLHRVEDQGCNCKSSWAVMPTAALSDRYCIKTRGRFRNGQLSSQNVLSCCYYCSNQGQGGCGGGSSMWAWVYLQHNGTVTGGSYGSNEGCQAYKISPCDKRNYDKKSGKRDETSKCKKKCDDDSGYMQYFHTSKSYAHKNSTVTAIQRDIFKNGPLTADIKVYEDFYCYQSGIYSHKVGKQVDHITVKLIGWGEERGEKYWLATNSWGNQWGEDGFFRIKRGVNECNIEMFVTGGHPFLGNIKE